MALRPIHSVAELKNYLHVALQLEHATIPPYLTALYSLEPETNIDAMNVIRTVAVEEMLHLTLAANLLNAIGGSPDLTRKDFVVSYPTCLPNGETDFEVSLRKFSPEAIETFLNIERPSLPDGDTQEAANEVPITASRAVLMKQAATADEASVHAVGTRFSATLIPHVKFEEAPHDDHMVFYSIGDFYLAILHGMEELSERLGEEALFCGDPSRQIGPEYYYSGGGDVIQVTDLASARAAITLISEQGEGYDGGIMDHDQELSHYYRFMQIKTGKYYNAGDDPEEPTGEPLEIDWDAVYPIKPNAKVADYPEGSQVRAAAIDFNTQYGEFLGMINRAFNGDPQLLIPAVGNMFRIKNTAIQLVRNPIPGTDGLNASPTFEVA